MVDPSTLTQSASHLPGASQLPVRTRYKLIFYYVENDGLLLLPPGKPGILPGTSYTSSYLFTVCTPIAAAAGGGKPKHKQTDNNRWPFAHFAASSTSQAKSTRLHSFWQQTSRFGSTICSVTALANANILRLFPFPSEICATNERRWCI